MKLTRILIFFSSLRVPCVGHYSGAYSTTRCLQFNLPGVDPETAGTSWSMIKKRLTTLKTNFLRFSGSSQQHAYISNI